MSRAARAAFSRTCDLGGLRKSLGAVPEPDLLPLRDPAFALREAAKHLLLLEDHLIHPDRRCADCIGKHTLTAEAFADEAVQLGGDQAGLGDEVARVVRRLWERMRANQVAAPAAAAEVRALRKRLYAGLPG